MNNLNNIEKNFVLKNNKDKVKKKNKIKNKEITKVASEIKIINQEQIQVLDN